MRALPLTLETSVREIGKRLSSSEPCIWVNDEPLQEDLDHLIREGSEESRFDPLGLRRQMLEDLRAGKAQLICRRCPLAKVLLIIYPQAAKAFPWKLWERIFQAFGLHTSRIPWRITVFANPRPREFPERGSEPGPENVNGGYAMPNDPRSVVIYRLEECSRVLVHELLHAAGTDNMHDSEEQRESLTESWAEIFLIAVQAAGHPRKAAKLWKNQRQWISNQEALLEKEHGVVSLEHYAARYTTERREVFENLGLDLPKADANPRKQVQNSLTFTHPSLH